MKESKENFTEVLERLKWIIEQAEKQGVERVAALIYATNKEAEAKPSEILTCSNAFVRLLLNCKHTKLWRLEQAGKIKKLSHGVYDLRTVMNYKRESRNAEKPKNQMKGEDR